MNLTVNKLPSTTWNRLHMNEAAVSLEEELQNFVPGADYNPREILWEGTRNEASRLCGDLSAVTADARLGYGETAAGIRMEQPLVLAYAYGAGDRAASRLCLHAGADSHLKAVLVLSGAADISALQAEILAEENARVDLYLVDLLGSEALCLNHIAGTLESHAEVNLIRMDLGGRKIYSGVNMELLGDHSGYSSETGYHVKPGQLLDMNYVAVHRGRSTECTMQVNGTVEEGAKRSSAEPSISARAAPVPEPQKMKMCC